MSQPPADSIATRLLASVNLRLDADRPERIRHFRPTAKACSMLSALLSETGGAYLIVAPYGSGKSIAAGYLLHLIENRPDSRPMLAEVESRVGSARNEFAPRAARHRDPAEPHGLVLALHGHTESLAAALRAAAIASMTRLRFSPQRIRAIEKLPAETIDDATALVTALSAKARDWGCDRIAILWDEAGRHLEALVAQGRCSDLLELQTLAERAVRTDRVPITLALVLHQDLLHHADRAPETVRSEWRKIEGRFSTIQYVDDSAEVYRLLAEAVAARAGEVSTNGTDFARAAEQCHQLGILREFPASELRQLLAQAYPLEPVTLYMLPRISARVAQNERTLFSFVCGADLTQPVAAHQLYDYFAAGMRADTAVGGTRRHWVETETAIAHATCDDSAAALKTACMLGFGAVGERARASRALVGFALAGYEGDPAGAHETIARLVDSKLLLHRVHSDDVVVWHGADVDLRGRLAEELRRRRGALDVLEFLRVEAPPPVWRPVEYNADYRVRRFLAGRYVAPEEVASYEPDAASPDGAVLYVLAPTAEERARAEAAARAVAAERILVAIPREPLPLADAALEVVSLLAMHEDADLLGQDPLVGAELAQMTDDARVYLQRMLGRLVTPSPRGPRWFHRGEELPIGSPVALRAQLSKMMRAAYPLTPRINNESIVRRKPTRIMINARKKLMLGILERSGRPSLGVEGDTPDASMFRTVLRRTGLYRELPDGTGAWAGPEELADEGLRAVWQAIGAFLAEPAAEAKRPAELLGRLMAPPYGVRAGVLPILLAAGLMAFPAARSLVAEGAYVEDVLPSELERLCTEPERYRLLVLGVDGPIESYLEAFRALFDGGRAGGPVQPDLIRACYDNLVWWKAALPPVALGTAALSETTLRVQAVVRRANDPIRLLLTDLPAACGTTHERGTELIDRLRRAKEELEAVVPGLHERAIRAIRNALPAAGAGESIRETGARWARCFAEGLSGRLTDRHAKGLLTRFAIAYKSDEALVESLADLLVGRPVKRWDDTSAVLFDQTLRETIRRVEEEALSSGAELARDEEALAGLVAAATGRAQALYERLAALIGPQHARDILAQAMGASDDEV